MEKTTMQLRELIENNVNIFNFDYPIFNESYKKRFEQNFIDHFYFDEIGLESPAKFIHQLKIKLNLIMPYWNKIYQADLLEQRILDNYDVTEEHTRTIENTSTSKGDIIANSESNNKNKVAYTDKPLTKTNISEVDFLTNLTENDTDIENNSSTVSNNISTGEQKETFKYRKTGNIGIQTDADAIIKYWESLRKIDLEIFNECKDLFMLVY